MDDLTRLNIPQRMLLDSFYKHGQLPLWNPYQFGGQPFFMAGQSGPLYLPNIVFLLFPIRLALGVSYGMHLLLVAFSMYALLWRLTRNKCGAFYGSLAFATSGFLVGHQIHTQMFDAICWMPLVFLFMHEILERFTKTRFVGLVIALTFAVYAGHPNALFFIYVMVFGYATLRLVADGMFDWSNLRQACEGGINRTKQTLKGYGWLILATVTSLGLGALQWLPTLAFMEYSGRVNPTPQFLLFDSMKPDYLLQMLFPFVWGGGSSGVSLADKHMYWEFFGYIGISTLVFVLHYVFSGKKAWNQETIISFLLGAFLLILCLGQYSPLKVILLHAPGFDLFRVPARYIIGFDFFASLIVAFSIRSFTEANGKSMKRLTGMSLVAIGVALVLAFHSKLPLGVYLPSITTLCMVMALSLVSQKWKRIGTGLVICLGILDMTMNSAWLGQFVKVQEADYLTPSPIVSYLEQHLTGSLPFTRVEDVYTGYDVTEFSADQSAAWGIPSAGGEDSLIPKWYSDVFYRSQDPAPSVMETSLLNVQYLVTKGYVNPARQIGDTEPWQFVMEGNGECLWKNPRIEAPAWVTTIPSDPMFHQPADVKLVAYTPTRFTFEVNSAVNGTFVVSQTFDPYWSATDNGKHVKTNLIGGLVTGVPIHQGKNIVTLTYRPTPIYDGLYISLGTLLLFTGGLLLRKRKTP